MVGVVEGSGQWIVENRYGFVKRDFVLPAIALRLGAVPFEVHSLVDAIQVASNVHNEGRAPLLRASLSIVLLERKAYLLCHEVACTPALPLLSMTDCKEQHRSADRISRRKRG